MYWGEMQEPEVPRLPSSVSKGKLERYICHKKMKKKMEFKRYSLREKCPDT